MFINQKMENIHTYILQLDLLEASDNDDIYQDKINYVDVQDDVENGRESEHIVD